MSHSVISTFHYSIKIAEIMEAGEDFLPTYFSAEEQNYLQTRHKRTTAGWFALKKAITQLIHAKRGIVLHEKDIVLRCEKSGKPVIARLPMDSFFKIHVSISHTKEVAHGIAVHEGGSNG